MKKLMVLFFAALLVVAFTAPVKAATNKATFYGNVRWWSWIVDKDDKYTGTGFSDTDLVWDADTADTRFGIKLDEGNIKANLEVRPVASSYFRQFWTSYDFGKVNFLMGFTWSPLFIPATTSIYTAGAIQGTWGDMPGCLRSQMLRVVVPFSMGRFVLSLQPPKTSNTLTGFANYGTPANPDYKSESDTSIPRVESTVDFKAGPANLKIFGAYNTYDAVDATDQEKGVDSYILGGKVNFGTGPFSIAALGYTATNPGNYGMAIATTGDYAPKYTMAQYVAGNVEDAEVVGFAGEITFKLSDALSFKGGYGWAKYEGYQQEEDPGQFYFVRMPIRVAKGFTLTPEVGQLDLKDYTDAAGVTYDQGKLTWYGMYWQINF